MTPSMYIYISKSKKNTVQNKNKNNLGAMELQHGLPSRRWLYCSSRKHLSLRRKVETWKGMFWHFRCKKKKNHFKLKNGIYVENKCILVTCFILSAISPAFLFLLLLPILDLWRFNVNFDLLGCYAGCGVAVQNLTADSFFWK